MTEEEIRKESKDIAEYVVSTLVFSGCVKERDAKKATEIAEEEIAVYFTLKDV